MRRPTNSGFSPVAKPYQKTHEYNADGTRSNVGNVPHRAVVTDTENTTGWIDSNRSRDSICRYVIESSV